MVARPRALRQRRARKGFPAMCISQIALQPAQPEQLRSDTAHQAMAGILTATETGLAANEFSGSASQSNLSSPTSALVPICRERTFMTDEQHLWACALAVEKRYGADAPFHVAARIGALAQAGDADGIAMWRAIAVRLDLLRRGGISEEGTISQLLAN